MDMEALRITGNMCPEGIRDPGFVKAHHVAYELYNHGRDGGAEGHYTSTTVGLNDIVVVNIIQTRCRTSRPERPH